MIIKKIVSLISAFLLLLGVSQSTAKEIIVSSERELNFTEKPTEDCHASTVLPLENGNVVAAWFAGTKERPMTSTFSPACAPKTVGAHP